MNRKIQIGKIIAVFLKNVHRHLIILLILIPTMTSLPLIAQQRQVVFWVYPTNANLSIDGKQFGNVGQWTDLTIGTHQVTLSHRGYIALDTIIEIVEGTPQKLNFILKKNESLFAYEFDRNRFVRRKTLMGFSLSAIPLFGIIGLAAQHKNKIEMDQIEREASMVKSYYNRSISAAQLKDYRIQYETYQAEYDSISNRIVRRNIGLGIAASAFGLIALRYAIKIKKNPKPSYDAVTDLQMRIEPSVDQGSPTVKLSLKF